MRQIVYTMFIDNDHTSFHFWWKKNLLKNKNISKYYENDCLQNFLLLFRSSLIALIVKNSHILTRIYFIILKIILQQTWKSFKTKFWPNWKDRKSSYQVRQILVFFSRLSYSNFKLKLCEMSPSYQNCQGNQVWRGRGRVTSKK